MVNPIFNFLISTHVTLDQFAELDKILKDNEEIVARMNARASLCAPYKMDDINQKNLTIEEPQEAEEACLDTTIQSQDNATITDTGCLDCCTIL